jgi:hypothetical protein
MFYTRKSDSFLRHQLWKNILHSAVLDCIILLIQQHIIRSVPKESEFFSLFHLYSHVNFLYLIDKIWNLRAYRYSGVLFDYLQKWFQNWRRQSSEVWCCVVGLAFSTFRRHYVSSKHLIYSPSDTVSVIEDGNVSISTMRTRILDFKLNWNRRSNCWCVNCALSKHCHAC